MDQGTACAASISKRAIRVLTPNSQNNTDTLKYQNGLSNVVNDKGRLLQ
jgi:hypothetical protein